MTGSYSAAEFAALPRPACPVCGQPCDVDRIYVTANAAEQAARGDRYMPGMVSCPRGCDPVTGERWHGETSFGRDFDGAYLTCSCGVDVRGVRGDELAALLAAHPAGRFTRTAGVGSDV